MTRGYHALCAARRFCGPGLLALTALTTLLVACASPPPAPAAPSASYLVLLENDDGSVGQVRFNTSKGNTVLDKPLQATRLSGPVGETFEASREKISKDFASASAALPKKPVSFLLYFVAGGAKLNAESEADIPKILEAVNQRPAADISIIGHTDTAGDADANVKLGLERARFVATLLGNSKVEAGKIEIESHGEKNLLVATPDNTAEPRNRRVEVTIR